jgi:hypothetical protein
MKSQWKEAINEAAELVMTMSKEDLEQFVLDRLTNELYNKKVTNDYLLEEIYDELCNII